MNSENGMSCSGGDLVCQVDDLADQVKMLALNLAITLARRKDEISDLTLLEPDFTRLINGSVNVIREITEILRSMRIEEDAPVTHPAESGELRRIENSLNEILILSRNVLKSIGQIKKRNPKVDNYKGT
jgi:hypothetical protein